LSGPDAIPLNNAGSADLTGGPEFARLLLAAYPGPAILVKGTAIDTQNAAAQQMVENARLWWRDVEPWLNQVQERGIRSPLMVRIPGDGGVMMVEWTAVQVEGKILLLLGRNVTLERSLQEVLTDSRDRFRDLVELTTDLAWETRSDGTFSYIAGSKVLGYTPEELLGKKARDFVVRQPLEVINYFEGEDGYDKKEISMRRADGSVAKVQISARPLLTKSGELRGVRGICRDITEYAQRQAELARMQRRDRLVAQFVRSLRDAQEGRSALKMAAVEIATSLEAAGCRIYTVGPQDEFVLAAESGTAPPEVVNSYNRKLKQAGRTLQQEISANAVLMAATTVHGPDLTGVIWVWRPTEKGEPWHEVDQTLLMEVADHLGIAISQFDYQEQLRVLSECDGLTKLLNRRTFMEHLAQRTYHPARNSVLFYIDLDNFKAVNDTHGHQRGDAAIKRVAEILQTCARRDDLAGRIGGDEFVLWMDGLSKAEAEAMAARLVDIGKELQDLSAGLENPLGVSVGVAIQPAGKSLHAAALLEMADKAMYQAKHAGKSRWLLVEAG
jgi:diguanylate cyclase (GGDEF)-like protein/PAS domain S-box-containing protein